jgi:hypothetical protein
LICGSLDALPARFSALDVARREAELATPKGTVAISAYGCPLLMVANCCLALLSR